MAKKSANDAEPSPDAPSPEAGAPGFARGTSQRWGANRLELLKSLKPEEEGDERPGGAGVSGPAAGARALGDFAPGVELTSTAADLGAEPNAMFNGLPSPEPIAPEPAAEGAFATPGPGSPYAPADAFGSSEAPAPSPDGKKFDPTLALRKLKEAIREQKELQRQQAMSRPQAAAPAPAPAQAQARPPQKPTGRPPAPGAEARVGPADSLSSGSQREPGGLGRIAPEGRPVEPRHPLETVAARPPAPSFDSWQGSDAQESHAPKRDGAPEADAPNRESSAQTELQAAQSAAPSDGDEPPGRRESANPKDIPADLPGSGREAMGAKRAHPSPAKPVDGEPKGARETPSAVGFESGEARGGSQGASQGAAGAKPDGAKEKGAARESRALSQDEGRASPDQPRQERELAGFAGPQNGGEESAPIPSADAGQGASAQAQPEAERSAGGFEARPEAEPRDVFPEIEAARSQIAEIAGDAWRLAKLLERVERKLQGADRDRCRIRREDCLNKLKRSLADFGVRLIDLEGRDYEAGVAIEPVGMDRFPGRRDWVIEAMIEPIVMGPNGLIKQGVARVKPKDGAETEPPRNDGGGD